MGIYPPLPNTASVKQCDRQLWRAIMSLLLEREGRDAIPNTAATAASAASEWWALGEIIVQMRGLN